MKNIVVLDGDALNPGDNPWDPIAPLGNLTIYQKTEPEEIVERAGEAHVVLTNKTLLTAEVIGNLPSLEFISILSTGYNVVDGEAARKRGIPVSNVPSYSTDSVAEHVFALILELTHLVGEHSALVRDGEWQRLGQWTWWRRSLVELAGRTLAIVGYGEIGSRVGEIAKSFRMNVVAVARGTAKSVDGVEFRSLPDALKSADFVTLHCPLNSSTQGMISKETIALMKPTAYLINTARGPLVVEEDLAQALRENRIAGAGLDVLSDEPPKECPLIGAPNCIISPHVAWATLAARKRLMKITAENIASFLAGSPQNVVN